MFSLIDIFFYLLTFFISFYTYKKNLLTLNASLLAFVIAIIFYISGGPLFYTLLLTFFFSSSYMTKLKKERKKEENKIHERSGSKRDSIQVIVNSLAALIMAILYLIYKEDYYIIAFCSALAATNADTWASEIGILSKHNPISILRLKPVKKGISGGITLLGLFASLLGSFFITFIYFLFNLNNLSMTILINSLIILLAGTLGSIIDSILGDSIQAKYKDNESEEITEKKISNNKENELIKGYKIINNDMVNLLSSIIVSILVVLIMK